MKNATRFLSILLCILLLAGTAETALAEAVTLNIYVSGETDTAGEYVKLDGRFRIWQNGEEIGEIQAGESITLPEGARIHIEPVTGFFEPGWDLGDAYQDITVENGRSVTVPVVLHRLADAPAATETPVPAPAATPEPAAEQASEPDGEDPDESGETGEEPDGEEPDIPYTAVVEPYVIPEPLPQPAATPEPVFSPLQPGNNTGSVRVMVFQDRNGNGNKAPNEDGISGIHVYLLSGENAVAGGVTGADGVVVFENVPAGTYRTETYLPAGKSFAAYGGEGQTDLNAYQFSTEGSQTSGEFTVSAGMETEQGIGVETAYHVAGFCWVETNVDGVYESGEPMMPNVRITLDGQKNGLHYETISKADGTWIIDRVRPALYTLTVYTPDGLTFTRQANSGKYRTVISRDGVFKASKAVDLNDKTSRESQNIGFTRASIVKGICYLDANYNGFYDEGEQPLQGVRITAIKEWDGSEVASATSGADGRFEMPGMRPNTYRLRALLPNDGSTYTVTRDEPQGNHFKGRDGRRENFWGDFKLSYAETREIAIGAIYPATIKGTVYYDNDFSGTCDSREKVSSAFVVKLVDAQGNTVVYDKTGARGVYELTDVPPGEYSLSVNAVAGYAFTKLGEGNVILNRTGGEGYSMPFTVELGAEITGMDIGMIKPGTVEGDVYADRNDNGSQDSGERGLTGVTVRLVEETEGEAFRAEIGEDGHFIFDAVMPGRYYVEYILPEGAVFARSMAGTIQETADGTGRTESFDFATGGYKKAALCGALTLGRIEGTAYQDHNGNGIRDDGEEPLAGMTISMVPGRAELDESIVATAADGSFILEGLRPDTYTLKAACPEGFVMSRTDHLDLPLTAGKAVQEATLEVPMGATWTAQMTGAAIPAAIRGRMWLDENNNGLFDEGEQTPAGMMLTVTDNFTGKVFDTPITDENGSFAAAGMIPGEFSVSFPLDDNTLAPKPGDNQFTAEAGQMVLTGIRLQENETRDNLLLGIIRYTRIGGRVWIDRGGNIEALSGAVMTLKDENGTAVASVTSTNNGDYRFEHLMPGVYRVEAEMPEGCVIIEPDDYRLAGDLRSAMTTTLNRNGSSDEIDLKMNQNRTDLDIGCVLPGSLGDFCWLDLNGDGLQAGDELGIANVRVEALRDGVAVAETVTDQYGFYRISDLYPAVYTLRVTAPAEVKPTRKRSDLRIIASALEETDGDVCYTGEITVESDRANYNVDLGFVTRRNGVLPAGYGQGKTQNWQK